ncbi:MAG: hypothetical protein JRH20_03830 [Deltaproteobacteria bacterium]|nr:hypothetical protein [Deltaproteobacteria bacterium]
MGTPFFVTPHTTPRRFSTLGALLSGVALSGVVLLVACRPPVQGSELTNPSQEAPITLPPGPREEAILQRAHQKKDCASRRRAGQLLLDLHDAWRFFSGEQDEVSQRLRRVGKDVEALLRREFALKEFTPEAEVVKGIQARLRALANCSDNTKQWSLAALRLLDLDAMAAPAEVPTFAWSTELRKVWIRGGPLATNARVRLLHPCVRAFRHALREEPRRQRPVLSRCLYALFEAEPAPYFVANPAQRPPEPPWTLLREELHRAFLLMQSRFAALARLQIDADRSFFKHACAELPTAVDLPRLNLPVSEQGRPYDRSPVVTVLPESFMVDGLFVQGGDRPALQKAIHKRLRGDARATLTVVMPATGSAGAIYELGRAARREKVHTLLLGVRRLVAPTAAPGDVQARMVGKGGVWRLEGIPVSVRLLSLRPGETSRDRPRVLLYDPLATEARLALTFTATSWRFESRYGALPALRAGDFKGLRRQLGLLRRAFPEEGGLIVAPAHNLSYAELIKIVKAVRYVGRKPLFPALALAQRYGLASSLRDLAPLLAALDGVAVEGGNATQEVALKACCRRALARSYGADESLGSLTVPQGKAKPSVGASSWSSCLSPAQLISAHPPRCIPGVPPMTHAEKKTLPPGA